MSWTPEKIELLKKLWHEGLSCSQIAERIGGVTRNAVIGKRLRVGLPNREKDMRNYPGRRKPQPRKARKPVAERKAPPRRPDGNPAFRELLKSEPIEVAEEAPIPMAQRRTIATLEEQHCKWPIGDPQEADFHFCGGARVEGLPYCSQHARRAYQPPQVRSNAPQKRVGSLRTGARSGAWREVPTDKEAAGGASERDLEEVE